MSGYRMFIAAVAAMGLTTAVFAEDAANNAAAATSAMPAAASTSAMPAAAAPAVVKPTTMADASSATNAAATTATEATQPAAASMDASKVNVNKATAKELAQIKGMNPSKAKAIVAYRKKHGEFKSLDELKDVKGFKKMDEKTMKDLQDQLTAG